MSETETIVKIVMTGPTGVGKTSLLAAMYPLLESHFPGGDYRLVPEDNTKKLLDELRGKLSKLGEGGIKVKDMFIAGTPQAHEFNFDLQYAPGTEAPITDIQLQIWDIPGAYCTDSDGKRAQEYLADSDISFWCIDSNALMENGSAFNEKVNTPLKIADCIRQSNLHPRHTVCIVLMRSETYEQDGKIKDLFDEFKKQFGAAIAALRNNNNISNIYYCSIMTTGNLRFSYYDKESPVYIRHTDKTYSPQYCELPVLCAVRQSLKSAIGKATDEIQRMFNNAPPFFRWLPPWSLIYNRKVNVIMRLSSRLKKVEGDVDKELRVEGKNTRLFKY